MRRLLLVAVEEDTVGEDKGVGDTRHTPAAHAAMGWGMAVAGGILGGGRPCHAVLEAAGASSLKTDRAASGARSMAGS